MDYIKSLMLMSMFAFSLICASYVLANVMFVSKSNVELVRQLKTTNSHILNEIKELRKQRAICIRREMRRDK